MTIRFVEEVRLDYIDAISHYEEARGGLARRFKDEVDRCVGSRPDCLRFIPLIRSSSPSQRMRQNQLRNGGPEHFVYDIAAQDSAGANAGYAGQFSLRVLVWRESPAAWLSFWSLMATATNTMDTRSAILEEIALLASGSAQMDYEKRVPHALVAAELIEGFATDLYHPKSHEFVDAFTEDELKDLARLYGLVHSASQRMDEAGVRSVTDLQKLPEWRQVISLAQTLHDRFQRT